MGRRAMQAHKADLLSQNLWSQPWVAQAFQDQRFARPYVEMMSVFRHYIHPQPGSYWLDIGCGTGELAKMVWEKSRGTLHRLVGMDYNKANEACFYQHMASTTPKIPKQVMEFDTGNISTGLGYQCESFDGVTAGLVLSYAEHWDALKHVWTDAAYIRIYHEIFRVLKSEGELVFSVNVPNPDFTRIMVASWREIIGGGRFLRLMKNGFAMLKFSRWLKDCAEQSRFHYLPVSRVTDILSDIGFIQITYQLTYAEQAWVIRCQKS